jgi:hypothetical protein
VGCVLNQHAGVSISGSVSLNTHIQLSSFIYSLREKLACNRLLQPSLQGFGLKTGAAGLTGCMNRLPAV